MPTTYYDCLQVQERADPAVIKASYKALAQRYHPDRNPENLKEAERNFRIITEAYEVLSNADKRQEYDANLRAQREASSPATASAHQQKGTPSQPQAKPAPTAPPPPKPEAGLWTKSRFAQQAPIVLAKIAANPRVPAAVRWLLSPPWRLIFALQLIVAAYLFREILF